MVGGLRKQSGYFSSSCLAHLTPKLTAPDPACLESQTTLINLGRGRAISSAAPPAPVLGGDNTGIPTPRRRPLGSDAPCPTTPDEIMP